MEYNSLSQWIGRQLNQTMLHTLTLLTVMRLLSQGKSYFSILAFFTNFWPIKRLACLITLLSRKLLVFQNLKNLYTLAMSNETFFMWFSTIVHVAQLNCHQSQGFISYERIPNHRLAGFPEKTLRDVLDPAEMVEKCMDFCRDLNSNNSVSCGFFNLQVSDRKKGQIPHF